VGKYGTLRAKIVADGVASARSGLESHGTEKRRENIRQIAAISSFEGLRPTPEYEGLRARYILGAISAQEFKKEVLGRWKRNG